jgi:hypothetical protein
MATIKFNAHNVTNGTDKARVHYSLDNRTDGRKCVTIYAKDYGHALGRVIKDGEYKNDTDSQTDYFDKGRVVLFEGHALYAAARKRAEAMSAAWAAKIKAKDEARAEAQAALIAQSWLRKIARESRAKV